MTKTQVFRGSNAAGRRKYRRANGVSLAIRQTAVHLPSHDFVKRPPSYKLPLIDNSDRAASEMAVKEGMEKLQEIVQPEKVIAVPEPHVAPFAAGDVVRILTDNYGARYLDQKVTVEDCSPTTATVRAKSWLRKTTFPVQVEHLEKV